MKILKTLTISLLATSTIALAQTTMCFKENHASMATIESTTLDGGLCSSSKSVNDMKKDGWIVDDIKITSTQNGNNYIYIFKKDLPTLSSLDEEKLEQRIMEKLEKRKKEEIEIKKKEALAAMSRSGKQLYIKQCQTCHGEKGEIRAHNTSRPLNTLSLDDMIISIRDYTLGEYDRGRAFIMNPYAQLISEKDVKNVYAYLKTLKPKKEEKKEESK